MYCGIPDVESLLCEMLISLFVQVPHENKKTKVINIQGCGSIYIIHESIQKFNPKKKKFAWMNISYKQQTIVHNGVIDMESLPCSKSVPQLEWFLSP